MAPRMKHWIGLVTAGTVLVVIWLLPLSGPEVRSASVKPSVKLRYENLSEDYQWSYEALRRVRWSDSLSALTVATATDGVAITMPATGQVGEQQLERLRQQVRREIDSFGEHNPNMLFGFVYQPLEHGREGGMGSAGQDRTETYVGSRDGKDYCLQLRMHWPYALSEVIARDLVGTDPVPPKTGALGPCRFYVKYGLAGAGVQEWLEEGGVGFALERGGEESTMPMQSRRGFLGLRSAARSRAAVEINRCLAGDAEACAGVLLAPRDESSIIGRTREIVRRSPVMSLGQTSIFRYVFRDEGFLLADLEQEFGAEAFARFWTSDADVALAFEDAFGVDLGTWTLSWVESVMGIEPPGPGLPRSASSGSMLAVGLFLGIAFMRARKQKVA